MNIAKVIFILEDNSLVVAKPEELQILQLEPAIAAVVAPAGKNEAGDDTFRPVLSFPVVLSKPEPVAEPKAKSAPAKKAKKAKA
jgi:hypothetical protein